MENVCYKIMNAEGKFSTGGLSYRFNRNGKTWTTLHGLKLHLKMLEKCPYSMNNYKDCKIVCFKMEVIEDIKIIK